MVIDVYRIIHRKTHLFWIVICQNDRNLSMWYFATIEIDIFPFKPQYVPHHFKQFIFVVTIVRGISRKTGFLPKHTAASAFDWLTLIYTGSLAGGIKSARRLMEVIVIGAGDYVSNILSSYMGATNHDTAAWLLCGNDSCEGIAG